MNSNGNFITEEDLINFMSKINNLKSSLVNYVLNQYDDFNDLDYEIKDLASRFQELHSSSEYIVSNAEKVSDNLLVSLEDKEKYLKQVDSLIRMKTIVADLIFLNKHIYSLQNKSENIELTTTWLRTITEELITINNKFDSASDVCKQELTAYITLRNLFDRILKKLQTKLDILWESKIVINKNVPLSLIDYNKAVDYGDFIQISKRVEINMEFNVLKEFIILLHHLDLSRSKMDLLVRFISTDIIFLSILEYKTYSLIFTNTNGKLSLMASSQYSKMDMPIKQVVLTFITDLKTMLTGLNENLLSIIIPGYDQSLMNLLRTEYFDTRLTDHLINFFHNINLDDDILAEIFDLIDFLHQSGYISESNKTLTEFINDSDRRTRDEDVAILLSNMRDLFAKSLMQCEDTMFKRGEHDESIEYLLNSDNSEMSQLNLIDLDLLKFPKCKVSSSVVQAVSSVNVTIELYTDNYVAQSVNFLQMLPEMISMYLYVVPESNKDVLEQLPLAAVLHYNNCMYLAHHCLKWIMDLKFHLTLENKAARDNYKITSTDLLLSVYRLRDAAKNCIEKEINKQKSQFDEFLYEFSSFRGIGNENKQKINKCINKCCLHLSSLSKIYDGLPDGVFDNVFGSIVDWTLEQILSRILNLTDIIQSDNDGLSSVLTDVQARLVDIAVTTQKERIVNMIDEADQSDLSVAANQYLSGNCVQWDKLTELIFILNNGLVAIEHRWVNKDSGMSKRISASVVRAMVKALFKNSTMRSKMLEMIV